MPFDVLYCRLLIRLQAVFFFETFRFEFACLKSLMSKDAVEERCTLANALHDRLFLNAQSCILSESLLNYEVITVLVV